MTKPCLALRGLGALVALLLSLSAAAEGPRRFVTGSYGEILAEHRHRPLVLAFWSLTCPHCQEELAVLGRLMPAHPNAAFVLVSTDTPQDAAAIAAALRAHGLQGADSWVFADEVPERLRFEIDRRWRGELPRTHLLAPGAPPQARIGRVTHEELELWLREKASR